LRGLYTLLRFLSERRQYMGFTVAPELIEIDQFYSGRFTFADLDRQYRSQREAIITDLRRAAESTPRPEPLATNIDLLTRELAYPKRRSRSWAASPATPATIRCSICATR
jgi:hypothetical protein